MTYIGQETAKAALEPYIQQALATAAPLPHVFIEGQPGLGKTTMAREIAERLGDAMDILDLSKMTETQFVSFFRRFEGGLVFVDEIQRANSKQQGMLLQLMEEGFVPTSYGGKIECDWLTVIAATTNPEKILPAVLSRFAVKLQLLPYKDEEAAQIVTQMAQERDLELDPEVALELARASAGIPRTARDLVTAYKALTFTTTPTVPAVLAMTGIASDGLTTKHVGYLRALSRLEGLAGERPLCNVLRCHPSQLQAWEALLQERGYITLTARGRALCAAGDRRLNGDKPTPRRRAVA